MGGGKSKIKKPALNAGNHIKVPDTEQHDYDIKHPVFCLRYLNRDYGLEQCTEIEKVSLIERMHVFSKMTWQEIQFAGRHGMGSEKISQTSIRAGIPNHLSKDVDFLALRFDGTKPMVGYRNKFIFHIVYLDRGFTLYDHS